MIHQHDSKIDNMLNYLSFPWLRRCFCEMSRNISILCKTLCYDVSKSQYITNALSIRIYKLYYMYNNKCETDFFQSKSPKRITVNRIWRVDSSQNTLVHTLTSFLRWKIFDEFIRRTSAIGFNFLPYNLRGKISIETR